MSENVDLMQMDHLYSEPLLSFENNATLCEQTESHTAVLTEKVPKPSSGRQLDQRQFSKGGLIWLVG
ncbi:MAG: hypothetical protein ABIK07_03460 [Planctomycetota bacterium]